MQMWKKGAVVEFSLFPSSYLGQCSFNLPGKAVEINDLEILIQWQGCRERHCAFLHVFVCWLSFVTGRIKRTPSWVRDENFIDNPIIGIRRMTKRITFANLSNLVKNKRLFNKFINCEYLRFLIMKEVWLTAHDNLLNSTIA